MTFRCFWEHRAGGHQSKRCEEQCESCRYWTLNPESRREHYEAAKQIQLALFPRGQW